MKKEYLRIGFVMILIFVLKSIYSSISLASLQWFMYPMIPVIEFFEQITFVWKLEIGFYSEANIIIEKSCAGGNFFIICLSFLCYRLLTFDRVLKTGFHFLALCILSYFITIFANTFRIISAIKLSEIEFVAALVNPQDAHFLLGCVLYILTLLFINHLISSKNATVQIS